MTQFYSRNDVNYTGDVYSIPFSYIKKDEIKVYIDDELWTDWHFLNESQLTLDSVPEDIGYNNIISVRRETDIAEKVVDYSNNSLLNKENLNKSQDQLLYAVQEIYDNNTQFAIDIKAEVDEKVERVSAAVEKLEFLEDSVAIANEAALEATEQAQIATEKAEETLNIYNEAMAEIDTLRQDSIDEVNQLVVDHTDDLNALDQLIKKDADAIINRVGLNMFDTVLKDHILTYEESKGLALQGTWVYKEAIAGERYGYPDFYAKCLEEYQNGVDVAGLSIPLPTFTSNTTDGITVSDARGNADAYTIINGKIASGSGNSKQIGTWSTYWFNIDYARKTIIKSYTIQADNNGSPEYPTAWTLQGSNDGEVFEIIDTQSGVTFSLAESKTFNVNTNKIYSQYRLVFSSGVEASSNGEFGKLSFDVSVPFIQNPNEHVFYDITQKDIVDEVFESTGMAWFYGIDTENERIYLPRNNWFEQMTADGSEVGKSVEAGLPNITAFWKDVNDGTAQGAVYRSWSGGDLFDSKDGGGWGSQSDLRLNASRSSSVYKDDCNTVQPNAVKKLLYICVGNTVSNTSWVDVVTQVEGGVKDIENARESSLATIEKTTISCVNEVEIRGAELRSKMALSMFDTILKDHTLTYEESKGLALQGTYVYKEAVAGSRYGYADFYNKCLEEYNEANNEVYLKSNVTKVGSIVDNQGVLSGFASTTTYAALPVKKPTNSFELVVKAHTPTVFSGNSVIQTLTSGLGLIWRVSAGGTSSIWMSSNGTSNDILSNYNPNLTIPTNSDVWFKVSWNGSQYNFATSIDGLTWTNSTPYSSTAIVNWQNQQGIGGGSWENFPWLNGTIDLNGSYLDIDGERFWTGTDTVMQNPNGHLFYDISEKDKVDEVFNSTGIAWFYGVDTENERVFLPRKTLYNGANSSLSVEVYGNGKTLGLTTGSQNVTLKSYTDGAELETNGSAFTGKLPQTVSGFNRPSSGAVVGLSTSSTNSGIVGKADTSSLLKEDTNAYLYICVGDTEVTSAVTDVVEVTTTENDTLPLGYHFYQKNAQPSISYLKSEGQWNDGNVYATFYNEFVNKIGEPFASGKVVEVTETYTDYDLVINQDDMTFRLPLLNGSENLISPTAETLSISGLTFTNTRQTIFTAEYNGQLSFGVDNGSATIVIYRNNIIVNSQTISNNRTSFNIECVKGDVIEIRTNDSSQTARIVDGFYWKAKGNGSLYFKVANAVQNLELLDAGEVLEAVNNVVPNNRTVWDGEWVVTGINLGEFTAITSNTVYIDLTNILPKDGYNYMVTGCWVTSRTDTGGTDSQCKLYNNSSMILAIHTDGVNQRHTASFTTVIDTTRTNLGYSIAAQALNGGSLWITGYRRLGTNQ